MDSKTSVKNVRIAPKKLRFLAPEIQKFTPTVALEYLSFTPRHGARVFYKAVHSAVAAATIKLKTEDKNLIFKSIAVDEGTQMKRFRAGGRGVAKPIKKKFAHITIVITAKKQETPVVKKVEEPKKIEAKVAKPETSKVKESKPKKENKDKKETKEKQVTKAKE